jgi:hypothetical protein
MPKAPRDKDSATPKKRTRKAATDAGNGVHTGGNGAAVQSVSVSPEVASSTQLSSNIEERIRARAYEIYLERGGNGGSPEQDWLRAKEEICGRATTA